MMNPQYIEKLVVVGGVGKILMVTSVLQRAQNMRKTHHKHQTGILATRPRCHI
jgi:hypothetical protein